MCLYVSVFSQAVGKWGGCIQFERYSIEEIHTEVFVLEVSVKDNGLGGFS